jgi:hypothetical protein
MKMNKILNSFLLVLLSLGGFACSTSKVQSDSVIFIKNQPSADCKFLGSVSSVYTGKSVNQGFAGAKDKLTDQSQKISANVIKIVNYNLAVTTFKLSADTYYCQDTKGLVREPNADYFSIDPTN